MYRYTVQICGITFDLKTLLGLLIGFNIFRFINTTAKKIFEKVELEKYSKLFQERLEDGKKIAEDIRKQIEEFMKELREKAEELKGKLPQSLLSLKTLNEQIQERVKVLQKQMEDLQTKANQAYQDGQEKMLKNIEEQLEVVRGQLKNAKEQTKVCIMLKVDLVGFFHIHDLTSSLLC